MSPTFVSHQTTATSSVPEVTTAGKCFTQSHLVYYITLAACSQLDDSIQININFFSLQTSQAKQMLFKS